jgi:4-amino-4-deoxy-L-arabinose transferase-like glycosyltransferase
MNIHLPRKPFSKIMITTLLAAIYFTTFSHQLDFTDSAYFGSDTWEYQSLAVNLVKGHGFSAFGAFEEFDTYKFNIPEVELVNGEGEKKKRDFKQNTSLFYIYRSPGYGVFLAIVYKAFSISPLIVKNIQLLLLAIIAAYLPWLGMRLWKTTGFFSGLIASPIVIALNYKFSEHILSESIFTFSLFILICVFISFEKHKSIIKAALIGAVIGISLLIKWSLICLPILITLYWLFLSYKDKRLAHINYAIAMVTTTIFIMLPWIIYTNSYPENATMFSYVVNSEGLLDVHNEYVTEGRYAKWKNKESSFYNNDMLEGTKPILRVLNFYKHNPKKFIPILSSKLYWAFSPFPFIRLVLILFVCEQIYSLITRKRLYTTTKTIPPAFTLIFLNFILLISIIHSAVGPSYTNRLTKPVEFLYILIITHCLLSLVIRAIQTMHRPCLKAKRL